METFYIIYSHIGEIFISKARKLNENEKSEYAEWFKEKGVFCVGERIALSFIKWEELPSADTHKTHCLLSDSHIAYEISDEEKEYFIDLDRLRQKENELKENAERKAFEEKLRKAKEEKENMLNGVKWSIEEKIITDEGGKTQEYLHSILINGSKYEFVERNMFDVGRVINTKHGGLIIKRNEKYVIDFFDKKNRIINGDELKAYMIVLKYGKYAHAGTRM